MGVSSESFNKSAFGSDWKGFSDLIRKVSHTVDTLDNVSLPLDIATMGGSAITIDIASAALTALAGGVDAVSCFLKGDTRGGFRELVQGTAETIATAVPYAELLDLSSIPGVDKIPGSKHLKISVRDKVRDCAGEQFDKWSPPQGSHIDVKAEIVKKEGVSSAPKMVPAGS